MCDNDVRVDTTRLHAYADESGNSGSKIRKNEREPFFWLGVVLSPIDLDQLHDLRDELRSVGPWKRLHATEMTLRGVSRVADRLSAVVNDHDLRFAFVIIEKEYVAACKFTDSIICAANNPAISAFHERALLLRLLLIQPLIESIAGKDSFRFWTAYFAHDLKAIQEITRRVSDRIRSLVSDQRTKGLLLDALSVTVGHPDRIFSGQGNPMDAPNVVAIRNLVDVVNRLCRARNEVVAEFVHDRQLEFKYHLAQQFDISKSFVLSTSPLARVSYSEAAGYIACDFSMRSWEESFGLELADLFLFVMKAHIHSPDRLSGPVLALAETLEPRCTFEPLTRSALRMQVDFELQRLNSMPDVSVDQHRDAEKRVQAVEQERREQMTSLLKSDEGH
jgi:hypothetical protein